MFNKMRDYPEVLDLNWIESLTDRDRFLYLITFGCSAAKIFSQLLGYDVAETDGWQYQIFNT